MIFVLDFAEKIYADSSFYADPQKKYPTIEEQIKMARRVALSLTAPQNKRARGHTMFVKQVEKVGVVLFNYISFICNTLS